MKRRILTAVPLGLLVAWLILQRREWPFMVALLLTVEIGLFEFYAISRDTGFRAFNGIGYVIGALICLAQLPLVGANPTMEFALLLILILFAFLPALRAKTGVANCLGASAATMLGVLYVAFTLSWLVPLRFTQPDAGGRMVLFLFLVVWAGDIFAYLIGRNWGRTPFFNQISPAKTLEGAVAGLAGSILAGGVYAHFYWREESMKAVILIAGIVALAGQAGDLVESALKRGAKLKDSGRLLPGHGGMLDRVDSLLFAAPVMWMAWMIQRTWRW